VAERHEGFRRWTKLALDSWLLRASRSFQALIQEHEQMIAEDLRDNRSDRIPHLQTEIKAFQEQLELVELELKRRGRDGR